MKAPSLVLVIGTALLGTWMFATIDVPTASATVTGYAVQDSKLVSPRAPFWEVVLDGVLINDRMLRFPCLSDELVRVYGPFDLKWIRRTSPGGTEVNLVTYVLLPDYYLEVEGKRYYVTDNIMRDVHIVGPVDRDHWAEAVWARAEDGEEIFVQYNRTIVRDEDGTLVTRISEGSCPLDISKPDRQQTTWSTAKGLYR